MKKRLMSALIVLFAITSLPAQQITRAEYFFNSDPGQGLATAVPVTAADSVTIINNISIPANLTAGINLLFVRVGDNNGTWSIPEVNLLWISSAAKNINSMEYYFDTDPGVGNGTRANFSIADSINLVQNILVPDSLKGGSHILFVRVQNEGGSWSMPEAYFISVGNGFLPVSGVEYFFDTDPGIGLATPLNFASPADSVIHIQNIPVPALGIGMHNLFVRVKNPNGTWSFPEVYPINICTAYGPKSYFNHYINGSEVYFTDSSANSVTRKWLFGDNTSDTTSNPRHVYTAGNNYTVKFITNNSCGNDTLTKTIGIFGVQSIYAPTVPQNGTYIGYITGVGFTAGTTVRFLKDNSIDIPADTTIVVNSSLLKVLFRNSNATLGKYDVKVQVPSAAEQTLTDGVEIVPATDFNIWAKLDGRREMLINRWTPFRVVIGNNSNKTAWGVPVVIKMPGRVQAKLINPTYDSTLPQIVLDITKDHFFLAKDSINNDSTTIGYFIYPYLEAGQTRTIDFEVKSTSGSDFAIKTGTGYPFFDDSSMVFGSRSARNQGIATTYPGFSVNRLNSFCDPPPCIKCLIDLAGFIPSAGCAVGVYNYGCTLFGIFSGGGSPASNVLDVVSGAVGAFASCGGAAAQIGGYLEAFAAGASAASDAWGATKDCLECLKKLFPDTIKVRFSWDPNVKAGPTGFGSQSYTRWQEPFNYVIHFENQASATAPASEVVVTDYLDGTKLDISSLRFTGFGFADTSMRFTIPDTLLIRDIDLRPAKNAIVRVTGKLDSVNKLSFRFTTFDPATMSLTNSINDGFLNPNVNGTEGLGYAGFQVYAKPDLPTGTIINNTASIVFDNNPSLVTPVCTKAIDKEKPSSNVLPVTERLNDTTYKIHWTGSDAHAGLFFYRQFVSINDSAYHEWFVTDKTQANFTVHAPNLYKFYSIAEDYVGNIEDAPAVPDQVLTVTLPVSLVEFNAYKQNKTAVLRWTTTFEQNNRGFEIQRSNDGIHFSPIGWVAGLGNSSSLHIYFFTDSTPMNGKNFYRLNQIDFDNHSKLSEIRKVDFEQLIDFSMYPNPATDVLHVQFGSTIETIKITDLQGRLLWKGNANGALQILIPVQQLPGGLYMLEVSDRNGNRRLQKFIKASR